MNTSQHTPTRNVKSAQAFTLIELLVVISIIGILAALIIPLAGLAGAKKALKQTQAQKDMLVTAIENYHGKFGTYPPDNGTNALLQPINPGTNTLFYELTGVQFVNNIANPAAATFTPVLDPTATLINNGSIQTAFSANVQGFINTAPPGQQPKTFLHNLKSGKDYQMVTVGGVGVYLLTPAAQPPNGGLNTWRYDASSNARHNRTTYDLWTEVIIKGQTNIIGNW